MLPIIYFCIWSHTLEQGWPPRSLALTDNWVSLPRTYQLVYSSSAMDGGSWALPIHARMLTGLIWQTTVWVDLYSGPAISRRWLCSSLPWSRLWQPCSVTLHVEGAGFSHQQFCLFSDCWDYGATPNTFNCSFFSFHFVLIYQGLGV